MPRNITYLPDIPKRKSEWLPWYSTVLNHRLIVSKETASGTPGFEEARKREIRRCQEDDLYLVNVYGTIYEAENPEGPDQPAGGYLPAILYPFQIEVWEWLDQRLATTGSQGDGIIEKARRMGLSNICVFWCYVKWLKLRNFQARLASRNEDLVDDPSNTDSMMVKGDIFLQGLPSWLLQAFIPGFDWKRDRTKLKLTNKRTGNLIRGESTTANLGRGGRATVIINDEAAFMPHFAAVWTAQRASTRHRIAVSTVSTEQGMDFYNIAHGKEGYTRPAVLRIPWNAHPLQDEQWLQREMGRDTPEGIKREVLMDYFAGTGNWVYPEVQRVECGDYPFVPYAGPVICAMDDGFDNDWAIHIIQYVAKTGRHRVIESYVNNKKTVDWWGHLLTGIPRSDFEWDEKEWALVKLIRDLPPMIFVGDDHVTHKENITGTSIQEHLAKHFNIRVLTNPEMIDHRDRWVKLSSLLPMFDFNDTPGVHYALEALKRNRFPSRKAGSDVQVEAKKPVHDWTSHPTTAFEWYAGCFDVFQNLGATQFSWEGEPNE